MKHGKSISYDRCSACGQVIDTSVTFQVNRAGRVYCVNCYLQHDHRGKRFGSNARGSDVLRVMAPHGAVGVRRKPPVVGTPEADGATQEAGSEASRRSAPAKEASKAPEHEQQAPSGSALEQALERLFAMAGQGRGRAGAAAPATKVALTPFNAPRLAPLRCALACAHAARRLYEHRRPGDMRLRATLVLIAEVAAAGNLAARTANTARFVTALRMLSEVTTEADAQTEPAIAAVLAAAEAALALLRRQPWRVVDRHAHTAYVRAESAVRVALEGTGGPGVAAALDSQHTRAFGQARVLWSTMTR